jgi:hypothetical protein
MGRAMFQEFFFVNKSNADSNPGLSTSNLIWYMNPMQSPVVGGYVNDS